MRVVQLVVLWEWLPAQSDQETPPRQWRQQMPLVRIDLDGERVPAFANGQT